MTSKASLNDLKLCEKRLDELVRKSIQSESKMFEIIENLNKVTRDELKSELNKSLQLFNSNSNHISKTNDIYLKIKMDFEELQNNLTNKVSKGILEMQKANDQAKWSISKSRSNENRKSEKNKGNNIEENKEENATYERNSSAYKKEIDKLDFELQKYRSDKKLLNEQNKEESMNLYKEYLKKRAKEPSNTLKPNLSKKIKKKISPNRSSSSYNIGL